MFGGQQGGQQSGGIGFGQGASLSNLTGGAQPQAQQGNYQPNFGSQPLTGMNTNLFTAGPNTSGYGFASGPLGGSSNVPFAPSGVPGGVGFNQFGLPQQSISTADNPLTAGWLGLYNTQANQYPAFVNYGSNVIGAGMPVTEAGIGGIQQGMQSLLPSLQFYGNELTGNPNTLSAGAGAQGTQLSGQMNNLLNQLQFIPKGGFGSTAQANVPYANAQLAGNLILSQLPAAAQGLISGGQAYGGLANQLAGAGLNLSGFGGQLAQMGLGGEQQLASQVLNKMNINYQAPSAIDNFSKVMAGIGAANPVSATVPI
jgi:hypothetical protein